MKKIKLLLIFIFAALVISGCNDDDQVLDINAETNTSAVSDETNRANDYKENNYNANSAKANNVESNGKIYVYINGAIKHPGVYRLNAGDRIFQVVELAGGMKKNAKKDYLNLAQEVHDGDNIRIITKKQYKKIKKKAKKKKTKKDISSVHRLEDSDKVNINIAEEAELTKLSGIGPSKAKAIIEYRKTNGNFMNVDDLKNVTGIGDATFNNIKEDICV